MRRRLAFVPNAVGNYEANTLQWCFPVLTSVEAAQVARNYAPADHAGESTGNYMSYQEFTEEADTELRREELLGYMVTSDTEEALRVSNEPLVPSKIAVFIKEKPDGSKKRCAWYTICPGQELITASGCLSAWCSHVCLTSWNRLCASCGFAQTIRIWSTWSWFFRCV